MSHGIFKVSGDVTDLALLHWENGRFVLQEVAPGFTPKELMALAEMEMGTAAEVKTMD